MDPAVLDEIEHTLAADGPEAAVDRLCDRLRQDKDYHALFYCAAHEEAPRAGRFARADGAGQGPAEGRPHSLRGRHPRGGPARRRPVHPGRPAPQGLGVFSDAGRAAPMRRRWRRTRRPRARTCSRSCKSPFTRAFIRGRASTGSSTASASAAPSRTSAARNCRTRRKTGSTASNGWCGRCTRSCAAGWRRTSSGMRADDPRPFLLCPWGEGARAEGVTRRPARC